MIPKVIQDEIFEADVQSEMTKMKQRSLNSDQEQAFCTIMKASSGIAAELLEGGRTAHSRFKIPISVNKSSMCSISIQSNEAKLIQ